MINRRYSPIAKLKLAALLRRDKLRDLYDFGAILNKEILSLDDILNISTKISYLEMKIDVLDDESVYLTETNRIDLSFDDVKQSVLKQLKKS